MRRKSRGISQNSVIKSMIACLIDEKCENCSYKSKNDCTKELCLDLEVIIGEEKMARYENSERLKENKERKEMFGG